MSRTTKERKGTVIRVRITDKEKEWIKDKGIANGYTTSDIIRDIIDQAMIVDESKGVI